MNQIPDPITEIHSVVICQWQLQMGALHIHEGFSIDKTKEKAQWWQAVASIDVPGPAWAGLQQVQAYQYSSLTLRPQLDLAWAWSGSSLSLSPKMVIQRWHAKWISPTFSYKYVYEKAVLHNPVFSARLYCIQNANKLTAPTCTSTPTGMNGWSCMQPTSAKLQKGFCPFGPFLVADKPFNVQILRLQRPVEAHTWFITCRRR